MAKQVIFSYPVGVKRERMPVGEVVSIDDADYEELKNSRRNGQLVCVLANESTKVETANKTPKAENAKKNASRKKKSDD